MLRTASFMLFSVLVCATVGCSGGVKEQQIEVKPSSDPLMQPRAMLERYARGEPMGSEATSFAFMIATVKKTDPQRGEILEKGFDEIQKASPEARVGLSKDLLEKIKPSMTGSPMP